MADFKIKKEIIISKKEDPHLPEGDVLTRYLGNHNDTSYLTNKSPAPVTATASTGYFTMHPALRDIFPQEPLDLKSLAQGNSQAFPQPGSAKPVADYDRIFAILKGSITGYIGAEPKSFLPEEAEPFNNEALDKVRELWQSLGALSFSTHRSPGYLPSGQTPARWLLEDVAVEGRHVRFLGVKDTGHAWQPKAEPPGEFRYFKEDIGQEEIHLKPGSGPLFGEHTAIEGPLGMRPLARADDWKQYLPGSCRADARLSKEDQLPYGLNNLIVQEILPLEPYLRTEQDLDFKPYNQGPRQIKIPDALAALLRSLEKTPVDLSALTDLAQATPPHVDDQYTNNSIEKYIVKQPPKKLLF